VKAQNPKLNSGIQKLIQNLKLSLPISQRLIQHLAGKQDHAFGVEN